MIKWTIYYLVKELIFGAAALYLWISAYGKIMTGIRAGTYDISIGVLKAIFYIIAVLICLYTYNKCIDAYNKG